MCELNLWIKRIYNISRGPQKNLALSQRKRSFFFHTRVNIQNIAVFSPKMIRIVLVKQIKNGNFEKYFPLDGGGMNQKKQLQKFFLTRGGKREKLGGIQIPENFRTNLGENWKNKRYNNRQKHDRKRGTYPPPPATCPIDNWWIILPKERLMLEGGPGAGEKKPAGRLPASCRAGISPLGGGVPLALLSMNGANEQVDAGRRVGTAEGNVGRGLSTGRPRGSVRTLHGTVGITALMKIQRIPKKQRFEKLHLSTFTPLTH